MRFSAATLAIILPILLQQGRAQVTQKSKVPTADAQKSNVLDRNVIATGFKNNGLGNEPGRKASLTSENNFINFCLGKGIITDGKQVLGGSCNPAPMGQIPSQDKMPSSKFVFPVNMGNIPAKQTFEIKIKMKNIEMGSFTNAQENYYAAPQQLNRTGFIIGHTHVVIEKMSGMQDNVPTNPKKFAFFKGINTAADASSIVTADVSNGLDAGVYRIATINAAMNHQPVLVPVAQHGSLDDMVYFSVGETQAALKPPKPSVPAPVAKGSRKPPVSTKPENPKAKGRGGKIRSKRFLREYY